MRLNDMTQQGEKLKYRVIERFSDKYSVTAMCSLFKVYRSGYYDWRKRQGKEAKDQWLMNLVIDCQKRCKQTYGCRCVHLLKDGLTPLEIRSKAA